MSEETQAQSEPTAPVEENETTSSSADAGQLIADAKRYRSRAQKSEKALAEAEAKLKELADAKLSENEEWRTLAEKRGAELAELKEFADRGKALEQALREDAMKSLSDDDKEFAEGMNTEMLLKFVKRSAPAEKVATNESSASPVAQIDKNAWDMSPEERRKHWSSILNKYRN